MGGEGPGGSDILTVVAEAGAADAIVVDPGSVATLGLSGPQAGVGTVTLNMMPITYSGIEDLSVIGNSAVGALDTLVVNDDGGDNVWDVQAGADPLNPTDVIQIDDREAISYSGFDTVELANATGGTENHFRIHPTSLTGFDTRFTVTGDGDDVLELVGTANNDTFTQTTATRFTTNGVAIDFTTMSIATVVLTGLAGDDTATVDLSTLDAGVSVVQYDAGGPVASDLLTVTLTSSGAITQARIPSRVWWWTPRSHPLDRKSITPAWSD